MLCSKTLFGHTPTTATGFHAALAASKRLAERINLASVFKETIPGYLKHAFADAEDDRRGTDV